MKKPVAPKAHKPHATGKSTPAAPRLGRGAAAAASGGHGKPPHHQARKGQHHKQAPSRFGGSHVAAASHHKPAPKKRPKGSKRSRGLAGVRSVRSVSLPGGWLLGGNDVVESCVAAAVANHRLLMTGYAMSDAEILALTAAGQTIEGVLEAAGCRFWPVEYSPDLPLVLGVGPHAVFGLPDGWVSWGGLIRPSGVVEEAWWLDWT